MHYETKKQANKEAHEVPQAEKLVGGTVANRPPSDIKAGLLRLFPENPCVRNF